MYSDILMNGTKRFVVVTSHPTEKGRFAQTGVLFELEDLKEVSEQTADQIKYICNHKVTGRVTIHRILNPEAWETRDTYLKIEGTIIDDSGKTEAEPDEQLDDVYGSVLAAASSKEERELTEAFGSLVDIQHELEEDVRFTKAAKSTLAVKDGAGTTGLWQTVRLWQSFVDQRLMARQNEMQRDFQEKLQAFLKKERGLKDDELPRYVVGCLILLFFQKNGKPGRLVEKKDSSHTTNISSLLNCENYVAISCTAQLAFRICHRNCKRKYRTFKSGWRSNCSHWYWNSH